MGADAPPAAAFHLAGLHSPRGAVWTTVAWDSVAQALRGVWDGAVSTLTSAADATIQYNQTKDTLLSDWEEAKGLWQQFIQGRELDDATANDRKLTSQVVTLRQAYEAIERFRLGKLKDTVEEQIQKVEATLNLIKTQFTTLQQGAAAYGGRPSAGGLASAGAALNELEQAGAFIRDLANNALEIAKLFDLLGDIEDDLGTGAMSQGNTEVRKTGPHRTRRIKSS